ncbi:MAG TPA: carboxypeptidase-like regulatory domain-containing protein [Pyrinomonadaceae bacterium]|nr:carboxypeptidase-like regulatory domain-containing protein [Pyrinomonadaceae bacterium]
MLSRSLQWLLLSIFSCAFLLSTAQTASACSCGPRPTVLESFDESDEVVIVRVISVEKVEDTDEHHYVDGVRSTTMIVEKVFKGNLKIRDEIIFGQGGGADCIWTFNEKAVGHQFLFYLNRPEKLSDLRYLPSKDPGLWFAFGCGRSRGLNGATDDLLYLKNIAKVRGKTRISGTIGGWPNPQVDVSGKRIRIIGSKKTYETRTDKDGVFEIYDLPPGKYFVEPEMPAGWKIDPHWFRYSPSVVGNEYAEPELKSPKQVAIMLEPKKHAGVDIVFTIENSVRGRVLGPKGKPMDRVCVYLLRPEQDAWGQSDCTDEQGRFEITSVPQGEYVLVANQDGKPSNREPFRKIFYPSVSERDRAAVISIGPGETIDNLDIVIPKLEDTITIEGVLRYSDGKLAAEKWVKFKVTKVDDEVNGDVSELTDSRGRFTLKVLKGLTGELWGEEWVLTGLYKNCPKVEELLAKSGSNNLTVQSNVVKLTTEENLYEVELTFPFPSCEKVKE